MAKVFKKKSNLPKKNYIEQVLYIFKKLFVNKQPEYLLLGFISSFWNKKERMLNFENKIQARKPNKIGYLSLILNIVFL